MNHTVDLYWSFRSPYSYIVVPKLLELERDWDAKVNVRPVLPIAVRQPDFFAQADPLWFSYLMRDCVRSAEFAGLTLRWPRPDPVVMDYATRTYPKEQPHIHRLTRLMLKRLRRRRAGDRQDSQRLGSGHAHSG